MGSGHVAARQGLHSRFRSACAANHDISEHLGLLRGLAMDVDQVVEIGFRFGNSACALASAGKPLLSIDIEPCSNHVGELKRIAPNFRFKQADSLKIDIPECGLLLIDSKHTYAQLLAELRRHAPKVTRWIAMHDTETFAHIGDDKKGPNGLMDAIREFLEESDEWEILLHLRNNNGMTILRRLGSFSTKPSPAATTPEAQASPSQGSSTNTATTAES